MAPSVIVTLIICSTIVILFIMARLWPDRPHNGIDRHSLMGHYKMLLEALSELQHDPSNRKAWQRLTSAVNTISLVAPANIVKVILNVHDQMVKSRNLPPDIASDLLHCLRRDIGIDDGNALLDDYHIVPVRPASAGAEPPHPTNVG